MKNMFVSKRPSGFYHLFYSDDTGKRKSVSTNTKLKSEANRFLIDYERNLKDRLQQKNFPVITLSNLWEEILRYSNTNFEKSTTQIYSRVFKNLISLFGNRAAQLVSSKDIEEYKAFRLNTVSRTTVNIEIKTLRAAFNIGKRINIIETNPCDGIKQLTTSEKELLEFSEKEINLILNNIVSPMLRNFVKVGLYTGCRLNEIINLQIKDLDFDNGIIIIKSKEYFISKKGKLRKIPIPDKLNMMDIINTGDISPTAASPDPGNIYPGNIILLHDPERYIFCKRNGTRYTKSYISRKFKDVLRKLYLSDKFHFHCLRHTYGSRLAREGVSLYVIKQLMGHSSIKTTEIYLHATMEDLRNAVNKLSY